MVSVTVPRSSSRTSPPDEQRDHGAGEFVQRLGAGQRADRLVVLADFGAAAGEVDIGAAQDLADIDGGQARGLQPVGIERDQNFALDTADALDLGDAAHALQRALDDVVDEIGELLRRLARRDRGIGDDRQADDVDALDQRLVDVLRQVGAHAGDGVLDVVQRAVGVGFQRELDRGQRQAVGDRRGDVPHALDAGDAVFDGLGDLRLKLGGRRAELRRPRPRSPECRPIGSRVIASLVKLTQPSTSRMIEKTMDGSGLRIDHAEILRAISVPACDRVPRRTWS